MKKKKLIPPDSPSVIIACNMSQIPAQLNLAESIGTISLGTQLTYMSYGNVAELTGTLPKIYLVRIMLKK